MEKERDQDLGELAALRQRVAEWEALEAEYRETKRQLQGSSNAAQEWRTTFDAIHDAVCMLDAELKVLRCNRAMADLLHKSFNEILGRNLHALVYGTPASFDGCPACLVRMTSRRETATRSVHDRWYNVTADPVLDRENKLVGAVHIMSDITARVQAEEALRRRNHELTLLNRAATACSSSLDPTEVLYAVLEETCRLLDAISSSLWLTDHETGEVICQHATGPKGEILHGWRVEPGRGIVGHIAASGGSVIVADTRIDERHFGGVDQETGMELRSIIGVPLVVKQQVIGVIEVVDSQADRFDVTDLRLIEPLAATAASAIENARLYDRAQREIAERKRAEAEREKLIVELRDALAQVKTLSGLLPICANCKKIRDDQDHWHNMEIYVRDHSEADFTHGICPECMQELYPDLYEDDG